ncbi:MAG TPA: translation elongation factor Ts [Thermotogota bacterium]|nr:translation elongation factor Ts [Thermotogota bacterium]HPJ88398.1 translation elongation factor Ts [Thermotogota bacterium]HPR95435.1 translation elongation factor Ts [Thermotogota bacterium]
MAVSMELIKELRKKTGAGVLDCKKALVETDGDIDGAVDFLRKKGLAKAAKKSGRSTTEGLVVIKKTDDELFMLAVMCETDFVARTDEFKASAVNIADSFYAELGESQKAVAVPEENVEKHKEEITEAVAKMGENCQIGDYARFTASANGHLYDYLHFTGKIGVAVELECEKDDEKLAELGKNICLHVAAFSPDYVSGDEISEDVLDKEREIYRDQMKESGKPEKIIDNIVEGKIRKFKEERCLLSQNFALDESKTVQQLVNECAREVGAPITVKRFARVYIGE